jgi:hypothetical protein
VREQTPGRAPEREGRWHVGLIRQRRDGLLRAGLRARKAVRHAVVEAPADLDSPPGAVQRRERQGKRLLQDGERLFEPTGAGERVGQVDVVEVLRPLGDPASQLLFGPRRHGPAIIGDGLADARRVSMP